MSGEDPIISRCGVCGTAAAIDEVACDSCRVRWREALSHALASEWVVESTPGVDGDEATAGSFKGYFYGPIVAPFGLGTMLIAWGAPLPATLATCAATLLITILGMYWGVLARRRIGANYRYTNLRNAMAMLSALPHTLKLRIELTIAPIALMCVCAASVVYVILTPNASSYIEDFPTFRTLFIPAAYGLVSFLFGFIGMAQTSVYEMFATKA
ncbi:MAG TPA: hypothetical protein P5081_03020 [Phycisphaerae bacterium]|nr:hypothetical protein [Phycisphaerae bacterium]HRW51830.1 hypothetical protein [Phycisphaerae bacterium]